MHKQKLTQKSRDHALKNAELFLERRAAMRAGIRALLEKGGNLAATDARTLETWLDELQTQHNDTV